MIYLIKNKFADRSYNQVFWLGSQQSLFNFFLQKPETKLVNQGRFVRDNMTITLNLKYDEVKGYNYCCITNESTGSLYFYFLKNPRYANASTTIFEVEIDVFASYLNKGFNVEMGYLETAHVDRWVKQEDGDAPYIPNYEMLTTSEDDGDMTYIIESYKEIYNYKLGWTVVVSTKPLITGTTSVKVNGVAVPCYVYLFSNVAKELMPGVTIGTFSDYLEKYPAESQPLDSIIDSYIILNDPRASYQVAKINAEGLYCQYVSNVTYDNCIITENVGIDNAFPKTKAEAVKTESKLFLYPYRYSSIGFLNFEYDLKLQYLADSVKLKNSTSLTLKIKTPILAQDAFSIKVDENKIDNLGIGYRNTITSKINIPVYLAAYQEYLTYQKAIVDSQNATATAQEWTNVGLGIATSGVQSAVGAMTGNPFALAQGIDAGAGAVTGVANAVYNTYARYKQTALQEEALLKKPPRQVSGSSGLDALTNYSGDLYYRKFKATDNRLKVIENRFYFFGYALNRNYKFDNFNNFITSREQFNFIKLSNSIIEGSLLNNVELDTIRNALAQGVVFIHNYNLDFNADNGEVNL